MVSQQTYIIVASLQSDLSEEVDVLLFRSLLSIFKQEGMRTNIDWLPLSGGCSLFLLKTIFLSFWLVCRQYVLSGDPVELNSSAVSNDAQNGRLTAYGDSAAKSCFSSSDNAAACCPNIEERSLSFCDIKNFGIESYSAV